MLKRIRLKLACIILPDEWLVVGRKEFEKFATDAVTNSALAGFLKGLSKIGKKRGRATEGTADEETPIH